MKKSLLTLVAVGAIVAAFSLTAFAGDMEVLGVTFPGEKAPKNIRKGLLGL